MNRLESPICDGIEDHCFDGGKMNGTENSKVVVKKLATVMTPREKSFTEIEKHYELNNQLLEVFGHYYTAAVDNGVDSGHYQVAYTVGLRFVETALLEIPKHGYYNSTKKSSTNQRLRSSKDAYHVTKLLEQMLTQHKLEEDADDNNHPEASLCHVQKLAWLANEQQRSVISRYPIPPAAGSALVDHSAPQLVRRSATAIEDKDEEPRSFFCDLSSYSDLMLQVCPVSMDECYRDIQSDDVHTPIMQPNPSYSSSNMHGIPKLERVSAHSETTSSTSSNVESERVLHLSGLQISQRESLSLAPPSILSGLDDNADNANDLKTCSRQMEPPTSQISFVSTNDTQPMSGTQKMAQYYHEKFDELRNNKGQNKIQIKKVPTFQGRIPGSINGCTVIAPLLCISFFREAYDSSREEKLGLSDGAVANVIDVMTPKLLSRVRGHLGLCKDAFIVPSDVHDYLIDHNYLSTSQFVTVVGGNIFNDDHLNELVASLTQKVPQQESLHGKRIGATLFFLEHVVAIHRLQRVPTSSTKTSPITKTESKDCSSSTSRDLQNQVVDQDKEDIFFELIDSLPHENTFQPFHHNPYYLEGSDILSTQDEEQYSARIRCFDVTSFKVMLRWYAYSKLSDQNFAYMNQYSWDNSKTDFDPRVFQAFVWSSTD